MAKGHRTALGKMIDMDALRAKNERVRAVGNMNVNARGDVIDANDRVINDSTKRVNEQYMKSVARKTNIIPDIRSSETAKNNQSKLAPDPEPQLELTAEELEFEQDDLDQIQDLEQIQPKKSKSSKKS